MSENGLPTSRLSKLSYYIHTDMQIYGHTHIGLHTPTTLYHAYHDAAWVVKNIPLNANARHA